MADAMVSALLKEILGKLTSVAVKEFRLAWGLKKHLEKLQSILSAIRAVIRDAEQKQTKSEAIKDWLFKLQDAAYDAGHILDEFETEALLRRPEIRGGAIKQVRNFFSLGNPLVFSFKMAHKIKNVVERLDHIAGERDKFHFREGVMDNQICEFDRRQTSSFVIQSEVYGRDDEREKIIEALLGNVQEEDVSIYTIHGMGGLGKTTLAQLVFNDQIVKEHFELPIWVCVSVEFDIKRLTKAIIEYAGGTVSDISELPAMQRRLHEKLNAKRFLLVLDDVWNEDREKWNKLKSVLSCGAKGSSIIVTTRSEKVALIMATVLPLHHLGLLSDDDSWSLFSKRAFGLERREEDQNFVMIGKEIVKKCGGVPLAIKALGGLLSSKSKESEWLAIKDSELWHVPDEGRCILPSLKLSYDHLPSNLRQCFAYCSIFPKDHMLDKEHLIQSWMANGFIQSTGQMDLEDIGEGIFNDLLWRSFFQEPNEDQFGNIRGCKMHDLVHDLAQSITERECIIIEHDKEKTVRKGIRHLSYNVGLSQTISLNNDLKEICSLRSFRLERSIALSHLSLRDFPPLQSYIPPDFFNRSHLLLLELRTCKLMQKWSTFISKCKHLRFLDLSCTDIEKFPSCLPNLQTLKLNDCSKLRKLPKDARFMRNLKYLEIDGCTSLAHMPSRMGQLTGLRRLSTFIVGVDSGQQIGELKHLNKLCGGLEIKKLDNVKTSTDAKEANLMSKKNLESLTLSWKRPMDCGGQQANVENILQSLQPHGSLKRLSINEYKGSEFPHWMRDVLLPNLVSVSLTNCGRCENISFLGRLPLLTSLGIFGMDAIKILLNDENSIVRDGMQKSFPSLDRFTLSNMPNLMGWMEVEGKEIFSCLKHLEIDDCPMLGGLPQIQTLQELEIQRDPMILLRSAGNVTSLTKLSIVRSELESMSLPEGVRYLTKLEYLDISLCQNLTTLPEGMQHLSSLKSLRIFCCFSLLSLPDWLGNLTSLSTLTIDSTKLTTLPEGMQHLSSLQRLSISFCDSLWSLPDWLGNLTSLSSLEIGACTKLTTLPESMQHLSSLQSIWIFSCDELLSLPDSLGNLTSLSSLSIWDCKRLLSLPEGLQHIRQLEIINCPLLEQRYNKETGQDWHKIAHIPEVCISDGL